MLNSLRSLVMFTILTATACWAADTGAPGKESVPEELARLIFASYGGARTVDRDALLKAGQDELTRVASAVPPLDEGSRKAAVANAMLGQLGDRASSFMPPEKFEDFTRGKAGVGISFEAEGATRKVVACDAGMPAYLAGLAPGDSLLALDGKPVGAQDAGALRRQLRGAPDSRITLTVRAPGASADERLELTRAEPRVPNVEGGVLAPGVGYLWLVRCRMDTVKEVERFLTQLKAAGVKSLVLDLRSNSGGLLEAVVNVGRLFAPKGEMLRIQNQRKPEDGVPYSSYGATFTEPLVVLVDGSTAAGAEALAGALQDTRRAILLGAPTCGRGAINTVLPLADGSALSITSGLLVRPSGRVIDGAGVAPDFPIEAPAVPRADRAKSRRAGWEAVVAGRPGSVVDADPALRRAVELLRDDAAAYRKEISKLPKLVK